MKLPFFPSGRDAPHEGHPAKIETNHPAKERNRAPRKRESIDTLTIAIDDDSTIAAYLRLCPPTCPTATSKEKTQHCPRGAVKKGATKDCPPAESCTQSSPRAPTTIAITDKSRAKLPARSSPSRLLCSRPSLHKHPSLPLSDLLRKADRHHV
jgi:hypothetical protein